MIWKGQRKSYYVFVLKLIVPPITLWKTESSFSFNILLFLLIHVDGDNNIQWPYELVIIKGAVFWFKISVKIKRKDIIKAVLNLERAGESHL